MRSVSPIYLDMEPYDITNKACNDAVLTYVRAFDKGLRAKIYRAGYYGFTSSSAKAVATVHGQPQGDAERLHDHRGPRRAGRAGGHHGLSRPKRAERTEWAVRVVPGRPRCPKSS